MGRCAAIGAVYRTGSTTLYYKYLLLAVIIFGGSFFILIMSTSSNFIFLEGKPSDIVWDVHGHPVIFSEINHTIKTEGCSIPAMEILSPSIQKYVKFPSEVKQCPDSKHSLLETNKIKIWINKRHLPKYNVVESETVLCCYKSFYRPKFIKDVTSHYIDDRVKYDDCKYFKNFIAVEDEFVKVNCFVNSTTIYEQYFLFATEKKLPVKTAKSNGPEYNILILGIDAVSRLNFHRTMPKTLELLKRRGAVDMSGYNKVGDNTFPNLIPMLLGIRDTELKRVCVPRKYATFDNCPFLWEWFKEAGYVTALGEDSSSLGVFNYVKVGFLNTPTDYYLHTFIDQAEKNVGTYKDGNVKLCMHDKPFYKVLLDYVEDLTTTLKKSKLFGFFWEITMSHDDSNYPMVMDDNYVQFFKRLETKNYLNNTIVILMSDHGNRMGPIRMTKQGRLEERLPFLYILTPDSFKTKYSHACENLKLNSKRLTTPFDLHATLSDLIDPTRINNTSLFTRSQTHYSKERGISLFLPVPYNRTCKAADIDDHWCTCYKFIAVPKTNIVVLEAAAKLVSLLNNMIKDYMQCARLSLSEVLDANLMEAGKAEKNEDGWDELMVVVKTIPGGAIFDGTLRKVGRDWTLVGTASRLNLYGKQSYCVDNYLLKLYCYCS